MDINAEIKYDWKYGWDPNGLSEPRPRMNLLLKAILEKNVPEMERLFEKGATLEKANQETLMRVVFEVLDDYKVMKCMTEHGFQGFDGVFEGFRSLGADGFFWDLLARAWYLRKYDVFELVAANGFDNGISYCIAGEGYDVDKIIVAKGDVRAAKILLEYGFPREDLERCKSRYPDSPVIRYLQENPVVKRKIGALDNMRYRKIKEPYLEKPGLFGRKKVIQKNEWLMADYKDRIEAQEKLRLYLGEERWNKIKKKEEDSDRFFSMIADDMLNGRL